VGLAATGGVPPSSLDNGPNDKEFHAIIIDDEKRQIIIVQSKFYIGSVDHQPLQEVLAAWLQIQNLSALQASCNSKLQIKLEAVSAALEDGYEATLIVNPPPPPGPPPP
jgi:hypothetical protein